jgi:hypothetical protein
MVGYTRRRTSLLWQALAMARNEPRCEALGLSIATRLMEPPDAPQQQVSVKRL